MNFVDVGYYETYYPYAEQACLDSNGQLSETEDRIPICISKNI